MDLIEYFLSFSKDSMDINIISFIFINLKILGEKKLSKTRISYS